MAVRDEVAAAAAQVLRDGTPEGTAVLVDGRHLLTAGHVVRPRRSGPDGEVGAPPVVTVTFPFLDDGVRHPVTVLELPEADRKDLAVLDLGDARASTPPAAPLWAGRAMPDAIEVFGYPTRDRTGQGVWRGFTVSGRTSAGLRQLTWTEDAGTFGGHSGGPVIDTGSGTVAGILLEGSAPEGRFDRFLPVTVIETVWPALHRPWLYAGDDAEGHIRRRGTGQRGRVRGADTFVGRDAALAAVADWLEATPAPGRPLVITGQPGAGKSAVLARAVLDAEPGFRGDGVVFHARDATAAQLFDALARATDGPTGGNELLDHLRDHPPDRALAIMVDALDEAVSSAERHRICSAVREVARLPTVKVVVATRPLAAGDRLAAGGLLSRLGVDHVEAPNLVDLDDDRFADPGGLVAFAATGLTQAGVAYPGPAGCAWETYRADPDLAERLARVVGRRADGNFLVAALTATALSNSSRPVDPYAPGFEPDQLPASIGVAIDKYLDALADDERARVRGLLVTLAHARGAGIPDRHWLAFAHALRYPAEQTHLDRLRDGPAADYLLQTTTEGQERVSRLYHQALIDQLLPQRDAASDRAAVYAALLAEVAERGGWAVADPYDTRHAAEHAAAAGQLTTLIENAAFLLHAELGHVIAEVAGLPAERRTPTAQVLRQYGPPARRLAPGDRGAVLELAASHLGALDAARRLRVHSRAPLEVVWAHLLSPPHYDVAGDTRAVLSATIGRLGEAEVIVSAGHDGMVRVFDHTGHPVGDPLTGHRRPIRAVAVGRLANRDVVVSGGDDQTVRVWDHVGHPVDKPLDGHRGGVTAVAVGRLGRHDVIAAATWLGDIRIWQSNGDLIVDPFAAHDGLVAGLVLGRLGGQDVLVSAGRDGMVRFWTEMGGRIGELNTGHDEPLSAVAVGRLGERPAIISASEDRTIQIWGDGRAVPLHLVGHAGHVNAVAVGLVNGRDCVVSASEDSTVRIWDQAGKPTGHALLRHAHPVRAVAVGRLGGQDAIVSTDAQGVIRIWDQIADAAGDQLRGHTGWVHAVAVGELDGQDVLVSAGGDATVRIWDRNGRPVADPSVGHNGRVNAVALGRLGPRDVIVSAGHDGTVRRWDRGGRPIGHPLIDHHDKVRSVAIGRLGARQVIVSAGDDETVRVWDHDGNPIGQPLVNPGWVTAVQVGRFAGLDAIVAANADSRIRVWDDTGAAMERSFPRHGSGTTAAALGRLAGRDVLVCGDSDGMIRVLDGTGPSVGNPFVAHDGQVDAIALGLLGGREVVVSAGQDQTVRVWNRDGQPIGQPYRLFDTSSSLALLPDGLVVASGPALVRLRMPVKMGS